MTDRYVSTSGIASGAGGIGAPWTLAWAITSSNTTLVAGDTVWLRGGTYTGKITVTKSGSVGNEIIYRNYPDEEVVIDGDTTPTSNNNITVNGSDLIFWGSGAKGFRVTNSETGLQRRRDAVIEDTSTPLRGDGWALNGARVKLRNILVDNNDNAIGFWIGNVDGELYGCICVNNGWYGTDRGHGHGIYIQNQTGTKNIKNHVSFNNFATGMKAYAEGGYAQHIHFDGIISANNESHPAAERGDTRRLGDMFVGTVDHPSNDIVINNAKVFCPFGTVGGGIGLGYGPDNQDWTVTDSYIASGATGFTAEDFDSLVFTGNTVYSTVQSPDIGATESLVFLGVVGSPSVTIDDNTYFDQTTNNSGRHSFYYTGVTNENGNPPLTYNAHAAHDWTSGTGQDAASAYSAAAPTGFWVSVEANIYEAGRASIAVYNWSGATTYAFDPTGILSVGQQYEIRKVENYFGSPVASGTWTSGTISIPLDNTTVATPTGYGFTAASTAPVFNAFVLIPVTAGEEGGGSSMATLEFTETLASQATHAVGYRRRRYECDTVADRDAITGMIEGEDAYCKDVKAIATYNGTGWIWSRFVGGNVLTVQKHYTSSSTDLAIVTVSAGTKIVLTSLSVGIHHATTVDVAVRVGFGAANTPADNAAGVVLSHPGLAAGSGMVLGGGGILGIGADGEDLRITHGAPTTGALDVVASYYTIPA